MAEPRKPSPPSRAVRELADDGFASPREAARFLAIGKDWMYELLRAGAISHVRHGRRISVSWRALKQYAASQIKLGRIA